MVSDQCSRLPLAHLHVRSAELSIPGHHVAYRSQRRPESPLARAPAAPVTGEGDVRARSCIRPFDWLPHGVRVVQALIASITGPPATATN